MHYEISRHEVCGHQETEPKPQNKLAPGGAHSTGNGARLLAIHTCVELQDAGLTARGVANGGIPERSGFGAR
jgi:hypothetical protein